MSIRCTSCGTENREGARFCLRCGSRLDVSADADQLIGRLLMGRYRVLEVLGEGGMGRVYLAEQQMGTAARRVAVKVLHDKLSRDDRVRKRFHRECAIVIQLSHPHTIQFHDFGELEDGRLFIVMEYIEGHSLADEIANGPMPPARAERILSQIAGSLHDAHQQNIVHRDLKPDNILLTVRGGETDFVKVCDFGIAKVATDGMAEPGITIEGTIIGTPQYMSPEQLSGGKVDGRSDVYSLGLIAFEMLTGERPFTANTPLEWAARHTTAEPPTLDQYPPTRHLPARYKNAIGRSLRKSPDQRQPNAKAFAQEITGSAEAITPPTMRMQSRPPSTPPVAPTMVDQSIAGGLSAPGAPIHTPQPAIPAVPMQQPRSLLLPSLFLLGTAVLAASGITVFLNRNKIPWLAGNEPAETDAGVEAPAGTDAGPHAPHTWLRALQFERLVTDAHNSLGPPDQSYAVVQPQGTLNLEVDAGHRIGSDGSSRPDVWVEVDEERSGPYRADVGTQPHEYITVSQSLVGSQGIDVDQYGITRIRYIRIKNRGTQPVYIDAVGGLALVEAHD